MWFTFLLHRSYLLRGPRLKDLKLQGIHCIFMKVKPLYMQIGPFIKFIIISPQDSRRLSSHKILCFFLFKVWNPLLLRYLKRSPGKRTGKGK